jgi:hypothetical protein
VRLTDYWQVITLNEQHCCACEFSVKTGVLSACEKFVRQARCQFLFTIKGLSALVIIAFFYHHFLLVMTKKLMQST